MLPIKRQKKLLALSVTNVLFFWVSLTVKHKAKCSICKEYPIVGFR